MELLLSLYITSVWTEIDEYWVVYAHPPTLTGWQKTRRLNANVWRPEFDDCVLKTGGRSEAVLSWEGSNNVALHFSCSTTSLVLLVFDTQSSNSGLHTFALRRQYLFANQWVWSDRHNYSIFCSHRPCYYECMRGRYTHSIREACLYAHSEPFVQLARHLSFIRSA